MRKAGVPEWQLCSGLDKSKGTKDSRGRHLAKKKKAFHTFDIIPKKVELLNNVIEQSKWENKKVLETPEKFKSYTKIKTNYLTLKRTVPTKE